MAFGGVAIGNINAQLLAMVTGINKFKIGMFNPIAIPATTGVKTATNATLLISSVINNIKMINKETVNRILNSPAAIASVINETKPEEAIPLASAKPPPNNNKIPQANLLVSFQSNTKIPFLIFNGMANKATAPIKLIMVSDSFNPGSKSLITVLVIHKKTVIAKIVRTLFSLAEISPSYSNS